MPHSVEISRRTIIFIILFLLGLWLVFQIVDTLLMVFISLIMTSALTPFVDQIQRLRIPRWLAISLVYLAVWALIVLLIALVIPALIDQSAKLIRVLPNSLSRIEFFNAHQKEINTEFVARLGGLPESLVKLTIAIFGNLFNVFTTLIVSFYILLERNKLTKFLGTVFRSRNPEKVVQVASLIETRLGHWVRGELSLMFLVGLLTYVGLLVLGLDIALPLAVLAGLLEIIPAIGPVLSAIPAILIAMTISPLITVATLSLYILVQLFENQVLVPTVMKRVVGINPLISILSLMIGFKIAGMAGAVLAIPSFIIIQTIASEIFNLNFLPGEE